MKNNFEQIRLNIRNRLYNFIGSGSGRCVFDIGNGYVVKVAKNRKGLAQNEVEIEISSVDRSGLFAKILQYSEDSNFLIMQKAEKIESMSEVWAYFGVKRSSEFYRLDVLRTIADKHNLLLRDLGRPVNWGKINDKPVIIDYGFTRNVMKKYYSFF
ncbi:MAG: hypothetical protein VB111_06035 [Clostridiaceae bacterium]|nr:hypothetical protein [Clostridiaceae bacterium]